MGDNQLISLARVVQQFFSTSASMSSGALFGNTASRGASKNLVEFKAGKMTMKDKMVYPDTRKGQLYVYQSDDSLMHFCWKDRTSGVVEDVRRFYF